MNEFLSYGKDSEHQMQALFASVFVIQNRLQNACEKVQTEISMRQWHLLAMTQVCKNPKTLTNIGLLMGCSRQNVKSLANALYKKGFIEFIYGSNNSVLLEVTDKANNYLMSMSKHHNEILNLLFSKFSEKEINKFFTLQNKLLDGLEQVEKYTTEGNL